MATYSPPRKHSDATRILVEGVTNADPEPYLAKVTQRIQDLEDELAALRGCHNAVVLACRLPPEILVNIFWLVSEPAMRSIYWRCPPSAPLSWIPVTQVCRHWRSAALDSPNLWTTLQFVSQPFTELMLSRSRAAPLEVKIIVPDNNDLEPVLSRALSQLNRLRIVEISHRSLECSPVMPGLAAISQWKGSAPILERLILRNKARGLQPKLHLDINVPCLRVLRIVRCGIAWEDAPLGCQLTDLTLREDGRLDNHRPSIEQFQSSLAKMRFLQKLSLNGFGPRVAVPMQPLSADPVSMPSISILKIADTTMHASLVLRLLHLPDPKMVTVVFQDKSIFASLLQAITDIKQALGKASKIRKGVHKLQLYGCPAVDWRIVLQFHPVEDSRLFEFRAHEYVLPPVDFLNILDIHMDLSTVITLDAELVLETLWSEDLWAKFSRLPKLKDATVGITADGAMAFLSWWRREARLASDSRPCFPVLSKITFENQDDYGERPRLAPILVEILKTRSSPLLELRIEGFGPLSCAERASMELVAPGLKIVCGQEE